MKTPRRPRSTTSRLATPFFALGALALTACPGRLANPELFVGGGGGDGGMATCTIGVGNVETQLIRPRCATSNCHDRGGRQGGLDLESPGIGSRLVGVTSATCMGQPLVVQGSNSMGIFLNKVGPTPMCGSRMPQGLPPLSDGEMACMRAWVAQLGNTPPPDAGDMDVPVTPDVPAPRPDVVDARPPRDVPVDMPVPVDTPPDRPPPPVDVPVDMPAPIDMTPPPPDMGAGDASPPADATMD